MRPTFIQTLSQNTNRTIKNFSPFSQTMSLFSECKKNGVSSFSRIFFWRKPLTVLFTVISIIVNSINLKTFWPWSHIGNKVSNNIPSFANLYSSTAIMFKTYINRIVASSFHSMPNLKKVMTSIAMFFLSSYKTTAAFGSFPPKSTSSNFLGFPAITFTKPVSLFKILNRNKFAKSFTSYINDFFLHNLSISEHYTVSNIKL